MQGIYINGRNHLAGLLPCAFFGAPAIPLRLSIVVRPAERVIVRVRVPRPPPKPRVFRTQRDYERGRHVPRMRFQMAAIGRPL